MRHIVPISGKDSLATAIVIKQLHPDLSVEYVFNPTGSELPETFEWMKNVETYLGSKIEFIGNNLMEIIEEYGFYLPSRFHRYCTKQSKIQPFEKWIGKTPATVYYGIRADEKRTGYKNERFQNIVPAYPLVDAGIDIEGVYKIVNQAGVKPPTFFWPTLYTRVVSLVGDENIIKHFISEWQRDFLFAWRSRSNCFHCFNMRKYEWVGLLEFHPDLFEKAMAMETHKSDQYNEKGDYYWNGKGYPLTKIIENRERIFERRAVDIANAIRSVQAVSGPQLFDNFVKNEFFDRIFSLTSCGLFCGK